MDPLSGVLSLVKPHNTMCGGFDVGGRQEMHRVGKRKGVAPPPFHGGRMM
jgi:hypothetical protein